MKQKLRKHCLIQRNKLSQNEQQKLSKQIVEQVLKLKPYKKAQRIGLYFAVNNEVDLSYLWQYAMQELKSCYFPIININQTLTFGLTTKKTTFIKNKFGILEPNTSPDEIITADKLDIVFLPVVAFDKYGTRLGMGGGYYDRTFTTTDKPLLIGVAYDFQHQVEILRDEWDILLDMVVTETKTYCILN